jgi:hypothetical protein
MIKSRRMVWLGYVARIGRKGMHLWFLWEGKNHQENQDIDGRIILKLILNKYDGVL